MSEQMTMFNIPSKSKQNNIKRRWENGFQKWSDGQVNNDYSPLGKCGYGAICDYCEDNSYGRPCVRALNAMLRDTGGHIDYRNETYEEAWEGQEHEYSD